MKILGSLLKELYMAVAKFVIYEAFLQLFMFIFKAFHLI